jgi:hypothetical protein
MRLYEHFAQFNTTSQDKCFDKCDADPRCAAACLTQPGQCRLFKYGFDQADGISGSTAYIKPEVTAALASASQLSDKFPGLKPNTKLVNHYDAFDTLTPFKCFNSCKKIPSCDAASFTIDNSQPFNCFLFKKNQYTVSGDRDSVDLWTSFAKELFEAERVVATTTATQVTDNFTPMPNSATEATSASPGKVDRKFILPNTCIVGHNDELATGSADECFNKCDDEQIKCATACFTEPNLCRLAKFGFGADKKSSSVLYIKSEVKDELIGFKALGDKFRVVKHSTKLVGSSYDQFDTLTPSHCFDLCFKSENCVAASFSTNNVLFFNCFMFRAGRFTEAASEVGAEFFTSYIKA